MLGVSVVVVEAVIDVVMIHFLLVAMGRQFDVVYFHLPSSSCLTSRKTA